MFGLDMTGKFSGERKRLVAFFSVELFFSALLVCFWNYCLLDRMLSSSFQGLSTRRSKELEGVSKHDLIEIPFPGAHILVCTLWEAFSYFLTFAVWNDVSTLKCSVHSSYLDVSSYSDGSSSSLSNVSNGIKPAQQLSVLWVLPNFATKSSWTNRESSPSPSSYPSIILKTNMSCRGFMNRHKT